VLLHRRIAFRSILDTVGNSKQKVTDPNFSAEIGSKQRNRQSKSSTGPLQVAVYNFIIRLEVMDWRHY
jgi:hypothetical protein